MEKLLWEIPGVEYIYSTSQPGGSMAIVRFKVGEDEEKSIVKLNQKMFANFDLIPPGATQPLIKPRSIDDVPILALTLSSSPLRRVRTSAALRPRSTTRSSRCANVSAVAAHRRGAARVAGCARRSELAAYSADARPGRTRRCRPSNRQLPSGCVTQHGNTRIPASKPGSSCEPPRMSQRGRRRSERPARLPARRRGRA